MLNRMNAVYEENFILILLELIYIKNMFRLLHFFIYFDCRDALQFYDYDHNIRMNRSALNVWQKLTENFRYLLKDFLIFSVHF